MIKLLTSYILSQNTPATGGLRYIPQNTEGMTHILIHRNRGLNFTFGLYTLLLFIHILDTTLRKCYPQDF
jgi:hypothetical protein